MQPPSHRLHPCAPALPELGWQSLCLGVFYKPGKKNKTKQIFLFLSAAGVHHTASQPQGKMSAVLEESRLLLAACSCRGGMGCFEGVFGGNIYMYLLLFSFFGEEGVFCAGQLLPGSRNNLAKRGGK